MFKIKFIYLTIIQIRLSFFIYLPNAFFKFCRVFFSDSSFIDTIEFDKAAFVTAIIFIIHIFIVDNIIKRFYKTINNSDYLKKDIEEILYTHENIFTKTILQIFACSVILNSFLFFLYKDYYAFWCVCIFLEIIIIIYVYAMLKEYY